MGNNFSRKANQDVNTQGSGNSVDNSQWDAWNEYVFSCFKPKEKDRGDGKARKQRVVSGVVNFVMDLGFPQAADSQWETKCALPAEGEVYSSEEEQYIRENPTHDFVWAKDWDSNADNGRGGKGAMVQKRKQTSPSYPKQEYALCVDVVGIMVDWSKHPFSEATEPDLRPYRISLNGLFNREMQKPISFEANWKTKMISDKNLIYKVCAAAGKEQELIDSGFDIGTVAGAVCNFKVTLDIARGDRTFLNDAISTPSPLEDILDMDDEVVATVAQQLTKIEGTNGLAPFTGILLNGMDYTDEMLMMVGSDKYGFVKRAETSTSWEIKGTSAKGDYSFEKGLDYGSSDFAKAYEKWKSAKASEKPQSGGESKPKQTPVQKDKPAEKAPEKVVTPQEPEGEEFDEFADIPF